MCDSMGAKFFGAQTELLWGRMLVERAAPGDTDRARELLTHAHGIARELGYRAVEERAQSALARLG
jgi:hypothetical protein